MGVKLIVIELWPFERSHFWKHFAFQGEEIASSTTLAIFNGLFLSLVHLL